jgi:cysteinyl-tRNA synthetase
LSVPTRRGPLEGEPNTQSLEDVADLHKPFLEAMDDDFNTAAAVRVLFELLTTLNHFADSKSLEGPSPAADDLAAFRRGVAVLREVGGVLGLFLRPPASASAASDQLVAGLVQMLIDLRETLRSEARLTKDAELETKLFAQTDVIRSRLKDLGIILEDRLGGTGWRRG